MIKEVNIETSIKEYKKNKQNSGKVALYNKEKKCVFLY